MQQLSALVPSLLLRQDAMAGKAPAPCSYKVTLTDHSAYLAAVSCCCGAVPLEDCLEPRQAGCCGAWPDAVIC